MRRKNKAAIALGKKRWAKTTKKERVEQTKKMRDYRWGHKKCKEKKEEEEKRIKDRINKRI